MSELAPMSLAVLARRALVEHERVGAIYDLPERKWYVGNKDLDTSVEFHGERASTPLGPAAGPQSQMAQNIVLSWLGGSRIMELKTVQVKDDLEIARPCIDATNVGYNIEWSQELKVDESLIEYAKAWMLIRILEESGVTKACAEARPHTLFDLSVGYDLAGIRTDKVTGFIRGMMDASKVIDALRAELTGDLAVYRDLDFAPRLSDCVTLSTFHGCPADEIESIVNYLLEELGLHVVVKMNPTLHGYPAVCELLNDTLGYEEIQPIETEFASDLKWDEALGMMARLQKTADARGLTLGAKFTNTLVVQNHRSFFPSDDRMYMSGAPLYPISLSLAHKFRAAYGAQLPISFSAGIDAKNFTDAVACGLKPITTCTDLLRPGGYGRLFKYQANLEKSMTKLNVGNIEEFIFEVEGARAAGITDVDEASLYNMARIVPRVLADKRYRYEKNRAVPRKIGSTLMLFDCINCDKCIPVCPNNANFVYDTTEASGVTQEAVVLNGAVTIRTGVPFVVEKTHQIANYADFCNDCGNCDIFCPEDGGPYIEKPRFFGSKETFDRYGKHGGFYIEASTELVRIWAKVAGADYQLDLERATHQATCTDGSLQLVLKGKELHIDAARSLVDSPQEGHSLSTAIAKSMVAIALGVLDDPRPNPVNALYLGAANA